jgi:hypothetical protein
MLLCHCNRNPIPHNVDILWWCAVTLVAAVFIAASSKFSFFVLSGCLRNFHLPPSLDLGDAADREAKTEKPSLSQLSLACQEVSTRDLPQWAPDDELDGCIDSR